jgi:hypothetical protein
MVLVGTLKNPDAANQTTDLVLDSIIKKHNWLKENAKDGKVVKLPKLLSDPALSQYKFLVFCYVYKGDLDPYRGVALKADSDAVKYLQGLIAHKDEKAPKRLRFFFDYLDNSDPEIQNDAFKEFANADYKDYKDMAKELPADKIAGWLQDDKTPGFRFGLYGSLLGHCGKEEHAKVLRELLESPKSRLSSGVDGVLAGYILLKPKEGFEYARGLMADSQKDFLLRYAALRTARFFWDYRSDVIDRKDLAKAVAVLLDQKDVVDLAVEDLRKWEQWDMTERILAIQQSAAYKDLPVVRRAVLRFALSCEQKAKAGPSAAAASAFVAEQRKQNAQGVSEAEELLKLDAGK